MSRGSFQRQVYVLLGATLPEGILEAMLIPLYPFMVRHLLSSSPKDTSEATKKVGLYTGLFSSAFYMPLFVMNIVWGSTSDRLGRKVGLGDLYICILLRSILDSPFSSRVWLSASCAPSSSAPVKPLSSPSWPGLWQVCLAPTRPWPSP